MSQVLSSLVSGAKLVLLLIIQLSTALTTSPETFVTTKQISKSPLYRRGQGSAPLTFNNGRWRTEVTVGNQVLTLEVDTGSYDL